MISFLRGNPRFLRYLMSSWASETGDWLRNMTLIYLVLNLSGHSAVAVSINSFCEFAPIVLFGNIVGVLADRWNRKRTIMIANIGRAAIISIFLLALSFNSLPLIYIGAFIGSIGTIVFRAPGAAFTMQIVPEEDRKTASSLRQLSISTLLLFGPMLGTWLYMVLGPYWTLILNMLLFIVSSLFVSTIKVEPTKDEEKVQKGLSSVWSEMIDGFRYSWNHPVIRPILYAGVLFGLGVGLIQVLEIFVITEFLGLPDTSFSIFIAIQGVGMIISTLVVSNLKVQVNRLLSGGMIIMGIGLAGMVLYPSSIVTSLALVVFSFGQISLNVGMPTLMQTKVNYEYQGRVGMILNTAMLVFMLIAISTAGWLHEVFSLRPIVAGGGILMAIGGVLCFMMYLRVFDQNGEIVSRLDPRISAHDIK